MFLNESIEFRLGQVVPGIGFQRRSLAARSRKIRSGWPMNFRVFWVMMKHRRVRTHGTRLRLAIDGIVYDLTCLGEIPPAPSSRVVNRLWKSQEGHVTRRDQQRKRRD